MTDGNKRTAEDFLTTAEELRKKAVALKELRERVQADFNDPKFAPILDSLLQSEPISTRELIEKFSTDLKQTVSEQIQSTSKTIGNYCFKLAIFLAGIALLVAVSLLLVNFQRLPARLSACDGPDCHRVVPQPHQDFAARARQLEGFKHHIKHER